MDSSSSPKSTLRGGLKVDEETVGTGATANRGDTVTIKLEIRLNRGELVEAFDDYSFVVGRRQVIAAIDYGVEGMRVGGRRSFKAGPHLCYGDTGVAGKIPAKAALLIDVLLLDAKT